MDEFSYEELKPDGTYPGYLLGVRVFGARPGPKVKQRVQVRPETFFRKSVYRDVLAPSLELHSPMYNYVWLPGVNISRCQSLWDSDYYKHTSPDRSCSCGFYAYGKAAYAAQYAGRADNPVIGIVKASGRIIVGSAGMRAEKMEIAGLLLPETYVSAPLGNEVNPDLKQRWDRWPGSGLLDERLSLLQSGTALLDSCVVPYPIYESLDEAVKAIRK